MKKLITKCDLCGAEDKVTMQFNIPPGRLGQRTWLHKFFNLGYLDVEIDVCADCLERIRKEAQVNNHD